MNDKMTRLTDAILSMAQDMRRGGLIGADTYAKITLCHLDAQAVPKSDPLNIIRRRGIEVVL